MRIFILLLSLVSQQLYASPICEGEMRPIYALVRIMNVGLKLGDLDVPTIIASTLKGKIENPFAHSPKGVSNLSMWQKFNQFAPRVKQENYELFEAEVRALLASHGQEQTKVAESRELTRYLPGIQFDKAVDRTQAYSDMTAGLYQDRPVFVGRFKDRGNGEIHYFLIDDTHSDPSRRFVQLSHEPLEKTLMQSSGTFLHWKGKDLFVSSPTFQAYDLSGKGEVQLTSHAATLKQPLQEWNAQIKGSLFPVGNSLRFVSSWQDNAPPPHKGKMISVEITDDQQPVLHDLFSGASLSIRDHNPQVLDGHIILSTEPNSQLDDEPLQFFDITGPNRLLAEIPGGEEFSFVTGVPAFPFAKDKKWLAVVKYRKLTREHFQLNDPIRLGIWDLKEKRHLKDLDISPLTGSNVGKILYREIEGRPHAILFVNGTGIGLYDIHNEKMRWVIPENGKRDLFEIFHLRGEPYFLLANRRGDEFQVHDLATGTLLDRKKFQGVNAKQIQVFMRDGLPMALVSQGEGRVPFFIKLVRGDIE